MFINMFINIYKYKYEYKYLYSYNILFYKNGYVFYKPGIQCVYTKQQNDKIIKYRINTIGYIL